MTKGIFSMMILMGAAIGSFAQQQFNDVHAEVRPVPGFHGVEVSSGIDLYLSQGDEAVAVSASELKYREKIRTEVKDGILKIWYEPRMGLNFDGGHKKMKAYVSCKQLDKLGGSGGSDIWVQGVFNVGNLNLDVSGGSDFNGKIEGQDLKIAASGGSDVNISGHAKSMRVNASGGSDLKGYDFEVENCDLEASGGSDLYVLVNKELTARASGGSDIFYKGEGLIRDVRSSGSSDIKKVSR